jgi:hypothetical protein
MAFVKKINNHPLVELPIVMRSKSIARFDQSEVAEVIQRLYGILNTFMKDK